MRSCLLTIAAWAGGLLAPSVACAVTYRIGQVSQQLGPSRASVGASVQVASSSSGTPGSSEGGALPPTAPNAPTESSTATSESPTTGPNGETLCAYTGQANVSPCYGVLSLPSPPGVATPETGPTRPSVNPAALAEAAVSRLALEPGRIEASPSARTAGLTGAASWFWMEPAPASRSLSVSVRGERVTVSARAASVRWGFGDNSELVAGPGVPYRAGSSPAGAVRHVYQTRCLPGDQGHDPYVLSSCGPDGYTIEALVQWAISYTASGPVGGGGALPSRSTSTSIAYPVSEVRAFLTATQGAR